MKFSPKSVFAALLALLAFFSTFAFAALPASFGTSMTTISTDVQGTFDGVFPVVMLGIGLTVVITLVKRFTGKI